MILCSIYLIVTIALSVQSFSGVKDNNFENNPNSLLQNEENYPQSEDSVRKLVSNKNDVFNRASFIDNSHKYLKPRVSEVKNVLSKILQEVFAPLKQRKRNTDRLNFHKKRSEHKTKPFVANPTPEWNKWTEWSPCSVTCGKGREIRWRHCMRNCDGLETEMEEKTCQLPACGGKLFGIIKLG